MAGTRKGNGLTGTGTRIRVSPDNFEPDAETEPWSTLPMEQQATELTTGGWVFLIIAWTVITGLTAACFYRVRKLK